jgi:hypothetical protein
MNSIVYLNLLYRAKDSLHFIFHVELANKLFIKILASMKHEVSESYACLMMGSEVSIT